MSVFFQAESATDAWQKAARFLCDHGDCVGLHVEISKPLHLDKKIVAALDKQLEAHGRIACKHVAYTIFPEGFWRKNAESDPEQLFKSYNKPGGLYGRLQRHRKLSAHHDWGTYFQRLSSAEFSGRGESQLTLAIRALRRNAKPKGAVHLHTGMPDDDVHLHTGLPKDGIRKIGGPCLQIITAHVEHDGSGHNLSACALYRNHDFFEKALGNYIGLGHLLAFLSECSGMTIGKLHVISGHAYCPPGLVKKVLNGFA
jgi:hypothetical protein